MQCHKAKERFLGFLYKETVSWCLCLTDVQLCEVSLQNSLISHGLRKHVLRR